MRILIVDTVYPGYLAWLHANHPGLGDQDYCTQLSLSAAGGFQNATTYGKHLRARGHEVREVWANHASLQARWCLERDRPDLLRSIGDFGATGTLSGIALPAVPWPLSVVAAQIEAFRPDILLSAKLQQLGSDFLGAVRRWYGKAVGRHASALPRHDVGRYDLILSSLPNQVAHFAAQGIRAELLAHAFDEDLAGRVPAGPPEYGLTFVGSLTPFHHTRRRLLRDISRSIPIEVFNSHITPSDLGPFATLHPAVWGLDMYKVLARSRIVLNSHLDAAGAFANNLRLYEVPGMGALQLADRKVNLETILAASTEVAVYDDAESCVTMARELLNDEPRRREVAAAGQRRVHAAHTLRARTDELISLIESL